MKNQLPTQSLIKGKALFLIASFFLFSVTSLFAQEITLEKVVTETTSCNEFDVTLTITGNPPPIPQEVILVIDRSGSMGFDIPNDPNEPIDYAKDAAIDFVNNLFLAANNPTGLNRVGIVSYSTSGTLDIGLTNSSGQASIIAAINALVANGGTNIARGMDVADDEMTANATFDCITSRSIILLTDGVTNRDLNGNSCTSSPTPPFPAGNTACMNDAINESVGAQTTTVSGTVYDQTIFSVGLFGAISGDQQAAATHVMDESQNGGLFTTESAADLTGIYNQILGQLALAARDGVVTDVLGSGFELVAGSLSDPINATYNSGANTITWDVGDITDETLTLEYTIAAVGAQGCGIQNVGSSEITYVDDTCNSVITPFPNPEVCVPCPDITVPVIDQVECTDSVDYSATFTPGDCSPITIEFEWEFFLNNVSVGTATGTTTGDLSGTFNYTGGDPFTGDFRAELTYNGVYTNGCLLPPVEVQSEIQVFLPPAAPMAGDDQAECLDTQNPQTLTATASVLGGQSIVWYDAATDGTVVNDPSWSSLGTITYYAEAVDDVTNCVSTTRIPVSLTLYDCAIQIEKTASPNDTQNCNTIAPGEDITYTFSVTNLGNVDINNVEVNDPLIDPVNPIPGPASGDTNNNGTLEVGETWIYTAIYTVVQGDIINGQVDNTAEVDGTVTGSSASFGVNDTDSVIVTLCQNAEISITKSSDGDTGNCNSYEVDDVVNYTFTVTNEGDVDITDVVVTDPNLGGAVAGPASGDTGNDGILGVGEVWIYNAAYNVTQDDIDAEQITNTADVNGNTGLGAVTDTSNTVVLEICTTKSIALVKVGTYDGFDVNGNCTADVGDTITYAFTVTNTGNVTLTNVVVTDPLVTMVGGPIASLAPGAVDNTTFTASYIITQADLDAGQFTNQATATGTPPSGADVTDLSDDTSNTENDPTVTTICNAASIALVKVGTYDGFDVNGNCTADVGDTITYAFTVTNTGNVTLTNVVVTDPLVTMVGGPIASLAPGAVDNTTFTASYIITQADLDAGQFTNQATATGTPPSGADVTDLSDDTSNTENDPTVTTICNAASIALVKVGTYDGFDVNGNCTADVGDTITYAFTVTNTGNVTLTNVVVTDPLVTMVGGPIASLAPGAVDNTTFTASYIITQADLDAGQFTNQATATGTPPSGADVTDLSDDTSNTENDPTVTTICNAASIALVKVGTYDGFDVNGNCIADVGDTITYAFTVTNTGNVTLTNVVVTDPLVTMVGGPIASLAPGAVDNTTFTASYIITQADLDAGQFTNQATATGTPPSGADVTDLSDDTSNTENDPTVTTICNAASIALVKVGTYDGFDVNGNCTADVGDTITYAFTVTNTGNVTLTNVVVTDPLVTMVGGPIASLAPGAVDNTTFTASYIITQADLDAGQFTNQATATGTPPSGADVTDLSDDTSNTENDPTVTTICNAASIALVKVGTYDGFDVNGNCTADVGDTITYAFTVTNTGNVTLTNVVVTDPLVTMVGGPIASLAPGAVDNTTFTASYIITQADLDAGQFTNQATATGTPPSGADVTDLSDDTSNTENDPTVTTICNAASIALVKVGTYDGFDVNGNCTADVGDTITYAFTVTNTGNVTLTNVVVTDPLVTMVGGPIASLAPGAVDNTTFTASYIITQADLDAGQFTNQATATGTPPSGADVTDLSDDTSNTENDPTVTTICNAASIALVKVGTYDGFDVNGNCTADVGDTITYAFTVTNTGNVTLTNVVVTDPLVTMVGGPIASLAPGAVDNTTFTASYIITQADLDAGQFTNQATATGTPPSGADVTDLSDDTSNTENDPTVTTICNAASIALVKVGTYDGFDVNGNCTADVGDTITYAFTVTNTGNVTLTNVVVTDPLVTMVGGPIASLAPGAVDNTTFTASYIITQADLDAGQFTNQATATGTPPSGADVTDLSDDTSNTENDPTVTTICNAANIALVKVGTYDGFDVNGNCTADVGDTITYAFTVTNTGNVTLTNVVVTDPLVTMVGGPIASLAPGAVDNTTFTASYIITQADLDAGQFTNQATATGTPPSGADVTDLSDDTSNTENDPTVTTICNAASIALVKVGTYDGFDVNGNCTADVGDTITYAFTVTNTGNVTLTNVVVTDPLVTMVGGPIASLAPGAVDNTTFTASYIITQADLDAGQFTNQATATGTPPSGADVTDLSDDTSNTENDPTVTTICNAASIALVKVGTYDGFDVNGNCTADVGDTITYAFTVTNTGNVTLTNVVVTDPLVTMVGGPIASLAPGAVDNTTFTASYIITQADLDAGQFTNQATATGTPPSGADVTDLSDDTSNTENDPTVTTICNAASIALVKVGTYDGFDVNGNCTADVGDTITYAFTVTNTGNVTLTNVVVTDPLVTMVGGPIASLAPGAVDNTTFTASYIITQADLDAGQFTNQATATGTPPSGADVTDLSDDTSNTENDPTVTTICNAASIALVKVGTYDGFDVNGNCTADVGDTITYAFTVTNTGNVTLTNVVVTDPLVTMVGGPIASLAPGAVDNTTFTASYIITQADLDAGQFTNQATATGTPPSGADVTDLSDDTSNTENDPTVTTICNAASIALVKVGTYDGFDVNGNCTADVGDTITYAFTVTNTGNVTLTNVVVTDPLVTMVGGPIASLAPGAVDNTTFTASYIITQADLDAGQFTNQATATGTPPSGADVTDLSDDTSNTENDPTVTTICNAASIALVKVGTYDGFDVNGNCTADVGDTITYAFTVTNTGNVTLTNVVVTDPLVTMVGGPIASLAPGAVDNTTFTASYIITQADLDAGQFTNQATATGTPPSGADVTDLSDDTSNTENDPTVTTICNAASIALVKVGTYDGFDVNGNCTADVGDTITYAFTVTNTGNVTLTNVVVTDPLVTMVGGPIASLAPGAVDNTTFTASYIITQADLDAGQFTNQATATGTPPSGADVTDLSDDTSNTENDPTVTTICNAASIALVKVGTYDGFDVNGNCTADVGDTITYAFTVTNTGNVTLTNVVVTDPLVTMVGGPIASLAPGAVDNTTFTASYIITQADLDAGQFTNQATATGTPPSGADVTDLSDDTSNTENDPTVTTICNAASIALVKVGTYDGFDVNGNCTADVGDTITYAFTVTNTGNVTLTNVVVTDPLVTMVGGPIASLAPGAVDNTTFTASYIITQADLDAGQFTNQATATGTPPSGADVTDLSDDTSNTENDPTVTTICNAASIALVKVGTYDGFDVNGNCTADVGDTITYAFTVTNTGNVTLTNVVVTDPLVTMVGGPIASLAPGAVDNTTFTASYIITQADLDAGQFTNQATATGTPPSGADVTDLSDDTSNTENDPTVTTICRNPVIAIVKTGVYNDEDQDQCSDVDETITYTFVVTNEGNVSLSTITVTDPLVSPITFVSGDTNNDGILQVDETWTYTGSYAITQADIDAGMVTNQATAEGTAPDATVVDDLSDDTSVLENDPTVTTLCRQPAIAIVKTGVYNDEDQDQCSDVDETITYTFVVTNEGNVSLSTITVTDPLVSPITFVSGDTNNDGILQVDETWTYTGSYAITQADIDAGMVTNQATAEGTAPDATIVDDLSDDNSVLENDPTVTTLCRQPAIAIVKTGVYNDEDQDQCSDVDETITYTFVVTNEGNVSLSTITVTDPLVSPITFVSGDTNNDGILQVDETWAYTGSYAITQADIDAGMVTNQATAEGTAPDATVVDDLSDDTSVLENDPTVTTLCQSPAIAIVKAANYDDGGDCSDPGELINYTFTVTNEGNVSLANVVVTDPLLGGVVAGPDSGDTDGDNELDVTETWIYTGSYAITQDDIDAGQVTNQATATGVAPDQSTVTDLSGSTTTTDDTTITELCQSPAIAIVKAASYDDGGDCSDPGELINYTFTVTNEGNVSLANVVVTDPLLGGVVAGPDSGDTDGDNELDVTETWIYTGSYAITQDDIDAGQVTNQATATGVAPDQSTVTDLSGSTTTTDDTTITELCQSPAIAIVKAASYDDGGDCSDPGELINYTFTVTNEGNVSLANVVVTDPLLGGVVAGPDSGDTDGDNELDVTETWIYTGSYAITQDDIDAGQVTNQATATGVAPDQSTVTDLSGSTTTTDDTTVTTLCQQGAIAIVKEASYDDGGDCSDPGEVINYTFTVTNEGNVSLTGVLVDDPLLGGNVPGPDSGDTDGDNELDVTETWIYTGSYTITQDDIDAGEVVNQATASGTTPAFMIVTDLSGSTTTTDDTTITELCQSPAIAIVKSASYDDGGDCSDPGEVIDYTFTVTNEGNVSLTNVEVNDPLLGGNVPGPDSGDTDGDNELDVTETWVYTGSYTITQADIDAGEVVNQATATGIAPDQSTVTDLSGSTTTTDDTTVTTLCQSPDIAIVKTAIYDDGGDCSDPGESIDYTFTVTNEGNVSLANIVVTDPLLGGVVPGPDSGDTDGDNELDVTETWIYTGSYTITQADIDAGEVVNQATVTGVAPDQSTVTDLSGSTTTTDDTTITELCQSPDIAIVKTAIYDDGGDCSDPGESIDYTFTVTNEGNVSITNVVVTDPLLGGVVPGPDSGDTDGDNELDVTETWIYTGSYTITQADIDAGEVVNQATVTGVAPDQSTVTDLSGSTTTTDDTTITELCQSPDIAIVKTAVYNDGGDCSDPGEVIDYTFTVTNEGNVSLASVVVTDPLLGGVVPGPDSGDTDGDNELDVTETWIYTGSYTITQDDIDAGQVTNQATADGTAPDGTVVSDLSGSTTTNDDTTITTLCQDAMIALIKVGTVVDDNGNGCTDVGETINYTFEVINTGNTILTDVIVIDPLVTVSGGPITLNVGEANSTEFTAVYTVTQDDVDAGQVINQALAEGTTPDGTIVDDLSDDNNPAENDPTITELCQLLGISLEKTGEWQDENGDGIPQVGETIVYNFAVTNEGNVTLFNVTIDDPLPGLVIEGGPIAVLEIGETDTGTFTATYSITQQDIDDMRVINQAFATGTDANGNQVSDDSDDPNDLTDVDNNGDGDPDDPTVVILPNVESPFEIFNGVTPNGDGLNDFFEIRGIADYPQNNVKIFNRWGVLVFETDGYNESDNVFRGVSNGRSTIKQDKELPTGTYYYILTFTGDDTPEGRNAYNGYLYINR